MTAAFPIAPTLHPSHLRKRRTCTDVPQELIAVRIKRTFFVIVCGGVVCARQLMWNCFPALLAPRWWRRGLHCCGATLGNGNVGCSENFSLANSCWGWPRPASSSRSASCSNSAQLSKQNCSTRFTTPKQKSSNQFSIYRKWMLLEGETTGDAIVATGKSVFYWVKCVL